MKQLSLFNIWPALLIPVVAFVFYLIWPNGISPFTYVTHQPFDIFTLVTASLLHTNGAHLAMNLLAYGLIYHYSYSSLKGWRMLVITLVCGFLATAGFACSPSELTSLVGLSGALHGCLIYMAVREWKQSPWLMTMTLAMVSLKIMWEMSVGPAEMTAQLIGAQVAIWSHLSGALGGLVLASTHSAIELLRQRFINRS